MPINFAALPPEAQALLQQFPEFQPHQFNDSGANSYVLIGRHNLLQRDVALKIYFHAANEVEQEPALIAAINHESVLKVFDARKLNEGCSFFMTPHANYGDLSEYLRNYSISVPLAYKLLCQLLSGLSALHSEPNRLVHRDLKPQNLLVHDDRLLIADFGSVRRISEADGKAAASKHSILYRPREAFGPEAYFDFSSDCYQAGMIGYLMFGGQLSDNLKDHLLAGELKNLTRLEQANASGYDVSTFVDSCLQKRIQSGSLLNWDNIPLFVPRRIIRALKRAVSNKGRYQDVSEFLSDLAAARSPMPRWMITPEDQWQLSDWKRNDYLLTNLDGDVRVMKRRNGNEKYIAANDLSGGPLTSVYIRLVDHLKLP